MLSDIYEKCMRIGYWFDLRWGNDSKACVWSASIECATVAKTVYDIFANYKVDMLSILNDVMEIALSDECGFRDDPEDHGWDDYCRGFLAGQIFGMPTTENIKLAEKAEKMWDADDGTKYGYYQEVLEEVREDNWTGVRLV